MRISSDFQEDERRFRFIAEHSADVIWTLDIASGRFTYVSPSVSQLRGLTPQEAQAQALAQAWTEESAARLQAVLSEGQAAGDVGQRLLPTVIELDQPHKDGHLVATEVALTLHGQGSLSVALGVSRDITERKRAEEALRLRFQSLEQLASTDLLTGAWNRRHFEEAVAGEMHRARRYGHPVALLMLDIDHFKQINDTHGHQEGDRVLREMADRVRSVIRLSDSLTRWGGEEFIVLMPDTGLSSASTLAERIRESLGGQLFEGVGRVTVSIGVAEYLPAASREAWLERADQAMYRAKGAGRNRVMADPARSDTLPGIEAQEGTFLKLVWHRAYCCGHSVIDTQHERLFQLSNGLLDAVLLNGPGESVAGLVSGLLAEVSRHFQDEEGILAARGFPGLRDHAAKHVELLAKAGEQERAFRAGTLALGSLFQFLAQDVVALHMLKADREFFYLLAEP